jgi:CheY-like chemotaxis protein
MEPQRPRRSDIRPLVLIVDGHDDTRALYALALSGMGFDVVPARDGEDAYHRAWASHPDIIVTELILSPGSYGDGWELLGRLKADSRTRDIPVAVLTGQIALSSRERADRQGCAAFILKPCLPDELATELRHVLSRTASHVNP